MKTIHYALSLPRSGSTVIMNILQQNPQYFTTGSCPLPLLVSGCKAAATNTADFISLDLDTLNNSLTGFIKHGMDGWFSEMTSKPQIVSKGRFWDAELNFLFHAFDNPKFLVIIRDLRDIVVSYEKLLNKYPLWNIGDTETPFHTVPFNKRVELYCTDSQSNLGRPLRYLPHVVEWAKKRPESFFFLRIEDFNKNPQQYLSSIDNFFGNSPCDYDLNNIEQSELYGHDTVHRSLTNHKVRPKFDEVKSTFEQVLSRDCSDTIILNNKWFYEFFYPEVLNEREAN